MEHVEPEDLRNLLQRGVLVMDALLVRQRDIATQAEAWVRDVASIGGTLDLEPVHWTGDRELQAPFTLLGVIYRVVLEPDGRDLRLETLSPGHDGAERWGLLARGWWDGLHVELRGPGDSGDVLAPSATLALREALALAEGGQA